MPVNAPVSRIHYFLMRMKFYVCQNGCARLGATDVLYNFITYQSSAVSNVKLRKGTQKSQWTTLLRKVQWPLKHFVWNPHHAKHQVGKVDDSVTASIMARIICVLNSSIQLKDASTIDVDCT